MLILIINIGISISVYLTIALVLIIADGKQADLRSQKTDIVFDELILDYSDIPPLSRYECRDGVELDVRYYSSEAGSVLILLHGSGWHSRYLLPLARFAATENLAHVYTPDLRGHGLRPPRRGDIDYIDQLEDDLADLIGLIKEHHPGARIVLGGHSSGGALVVRFGGGRYRDLVSSYLLLTPFLKYNSPSLRPGSGGWAHVHLPRIIAFQCWTTSVSGC